MNAAVATTIARTQTEPYINVSFALSGKQLPADHGYLLYSAISRLTGSADVPSAVRVSTASSSDRPNARLHKADWLAIELISGFPAGRGLIALPEHGATLRLRIPADHYRDVLPLAGKRLDIGGHQIRLGLPVARPLESAPSLHAREIVGISQIVTSSNVKFSKRVTAFTEQGVAMLSSVLRSKRAIAVNVQIMRTFVRLRQMLSSNANLARKLEELEKKYDRQFKDVFDAIRQLMTAPEPQRKQIGFHARALKR